MLNYTSIQKNTGCQITDIGYEYTFVPLSSSKRDGEDASSEFDAYEAGIIRQNEAIYLQAKVNCREVVDLIDKQFGPFSDAEISFYWERLKNESGNINNSFQQQMIFNLFYDRINDIDTIYGIDNGKDYIKLMLAAKEKLQRAGMIALPYIISGKVEKLVARKSVSKKEMIKMEQSSLWESVKAKYNNNEKVLQQIKSDAATLLSSSFKMIDWKNSKYDGLSIIAIPDIIIEEVLQYVLLI